MGLLDMETVRAGLALVIFFVFLGIPMIWLCVAGMILAKTKGSGWPLYILGASEGVALTALAGVFTPFGGVVLALCTIFLVICGFLTRTLDGEYRRKWVASRRSVPAGGVYPPYAPSVADLRLSDKNRVSVRRDGSMSLDENKSGVNPPHREWAYTAQAEPAPMEAPMGFSEMFASPKWGKIAIAIIGEVATSAIFSAFQLLFHLFH